MQMQVIPILHRKFNCAHADMASILFPKSAHAIAIFQYLNLLIVYLAHIGFLGGFSPSILVGSLILFESFLSFRYWNELQKKGNLPQKKRLYFTFRLHVLLSNPM